MMPSAVFSHCGTADFVDEVVELSRGSVAQHGVDDVEGVRQMAKVIMGDGDDVSPSPYELAYALALAVRKLAAL